MPRRLPKTRSHFALWVFGAFAIGWVCVLALEIAEEEFHAINQLTESQCRGLVWFGLLSIVIWQAWATFPSRVIRFAVILAATGILAEVSLGIIHDLPQLNTVPLIGRDGEFGGAFEKLLAAGSVCGSILFFYCLLSSLDEAHANLAVRLDKQAMELLETSAQLQSESSQRIHVESERDRFFRMSLDILFVAGTDGHLKRVNPAMERILGYTRQELLACPLIEFIHPNDRDRTLSELRALQRGHDTVDLRVRWRHKDGSWRWLACTCPAPEKNSGTLYIVARDVTAEIETEEVLRRNQLMIDTATEGIFTVGPDARIIDANKTASDRLELTRDELHSLTIADIDPHYPAEKWPEHWEQIRREGQMEFETEHRAKSGRTFPVEVSLSYFQFDHVEYCCAFVRDITERKRTDDALRAAHNELEERVADRTRLLSETIRQLEGEARERKRAEQIIDSKEESLRESQERFRKIFEVEPGCITLLDAEGRVLEMNPAGLAMIEVDSIESIRGSSFYPIIAPDYRDQFVATTEAVFRGESNTLQFEIVGRRGTRRYMESHNLPLLSAKGQATSLLSVTRDVTDRIRVEKALRLTQFAVDQASDAVFVFGQDEKFLYVNNAACRSLGYTKDELQALGVADIDKEYAARTSSGQRSVDPMPQRRTMEATHRRKDGSLFPVELTLDYLDFEGRKLICAFARDITQRKLAERAQRESEEQLRALLNNHVDGVGVIVAGNVVFINDRFCAMGGYQPDDVLRRPVLEFIAHEDRPRAEQRWSALVDGTVEQLSDEYRGLKKDGSRLPIEVSSRMIRYDGQPAILTVFRDITERRRAEQQLQRLEAELAHVGRISTMGEMATGLAHEINQPLTAIANFADAANLLLDGNQSDDLQNVKKSLAQIANQSIRAGEIVRTLRNFVKRTVPNRTPVRVDRLAGEVIDLLAADARHHDVELKLNLPESLPSVLADRIQFQQILLNLIRNAFDAMADNQGRRRVVGIEAFERNPEEVTIVVRDTGSGITQQDPDDIFEAFKTTKPDGLGMGLTISRAIAEVHGGRLWAEPNLPHGASFFLSLPVDMAPTTKYSATPRFENILPPVQRS